MRLFLREEGVVGIFEIVLVGLALSMDAFAVTVANVFCFPDASRRKLLLMPLLFGVFQGVMPLLGYLAGSFAAEIISSYAGIVSLVILGVIGGKMIRDGVLALREAKVEGLVCKRDVASLKFRSLLAQSFATSIDAFVVGVSFLAAGANIALAAPIVAVTTALCCLGALFLGKRFGALLGDRAQIAGGIVLVAIGLKAMFF
jgi:putative Mn2+ efflux pump MntP